MLSGTIGGMILGTEPLLFGILSQVISSGKLWDFLL
jgi:hypothetical protein